MKKLEEVAANSQNPNWEQMIQRESPLYKRARDLRTEFGRDYTRIIHSTAYRRLKHKTQVFFSPSSDHICTRIEHVNYVESISYTIAKELGLNTELTKAIAVAHDIGHSPFGHQGEKVLAQIAKREIQDDFWHERNGLHFVDNIELLENDKGKKINLDLTYAVRDGIISHCGEVDEEAIKPRKEAIDLNQYQSPNAYSPYTWEACVVKIADKISYIGRDLEDAIRLKLITPEKIEELKQTLQFEVSVNNTNIIDTFIADLCENSSQEEGLTFSKEILEKMNQMKAFNYRNIYMHERLQASNLYFELVLNQIYRTLSDWYIGEETLQKIQMYENIYPNLAREFYQWLSHYTKQNHTGDNKVLYDLNKKQDYAKAILDYIAGMTDNYAIEIYNEIIRF